jgi:hypothetical protein
VQFKGSGWYVTDYGGKQTTDAVKSDSGDATDSKESSKDDKGKEKQKESKPKKETKTEAKAESKKSKDKD